MTRLVLGIAATGLQACRLAASRAPAVRVGTVGCVRDRRVFMVPAVCVCVKLKNSLLLLEALCAGAGSRAECRLRIQSGSFVVLCRAWSLE